MTVLVTLVILAQLLAMAFAQFSLNINLNSIFAYASDYVNAIWPLVAFVGGLGLAKAIVKMIIGMLKSF